MTGGLLSAGFQAEAFVFVYIGASVFLQTAAWGKGLTWTFLVLPAPHCPPVAVSCLDRDRRPLRVWGIVV